MPSRSPLAFFILVFLLSVPFWWIGSVTDLQLMPGLSVSALMTFCPMVAALLLVRRESGTTGAWDLLKRAVDFRRITSKRWYMAILLLMPVVSLVLYGLMRAQGVPLLASPIPAQSIDKVLAHLQIVSTLLIFVALFVGCGRRPYAGWNARLVP